MTLKSILKAILGSAAIAVIAAGCIDDPVQVGGIENRAGASGNLSNGGGSSVGGLGAVGGTGSNGGNAPVSGNSANGGNGNGGSIFTGGSTGMGGTGGTIIASGGISTGGISGAGGSTGNGTGPVVDQLALGDFFSCAQLSDGTVRCWGIDDFGELGAGATVGTSTEPCSSTPVVVEDLSGAVEIAAGYYHSCARLNDGTVKCWGYNGDGELGDGTTSGIRCPETNSPASVCRLTPVVVQGLSGALEIAARGWHSCALIGDGTVQCWGLNSSGELGDGTTTNNSTPVVVQGLSGVVEIAAGGDSAGSHTCALIGDGTVQCWGDNEYGELGDGTTTGITCVPVQHTAGTSCRLTPVVVQGLSGAVEIAAGAYHSCARLGDGTVQCWGDDVAGQLGNGATSFSPTPVVVQGLSGAVEIAAGYYHSCALIGDGTVECWGANDAGQLGDGATSESTCYTGLVNSSGPCQLTPVVVKGLSGAVEIRAGYHQSCARLGDGTVRCWGDNLFGELGDGTNTNSPTPVLVVGLP